MAEKTRRLLEILHRYLEAIALTRRPGTVARYRYLLSGFLRFLEANNPEVETFSALTRHHLEGWLRHEATRKGHRKDTPLRKSTRRSNVIFLHRFLEDLSAWGWAEAPSEEGLIRRSDLPPPDQYLPKPLSQESDQALRKELRAMGSLPALGLLLARATGIRVGELRNLELDCLQEMPDHQWTLHVPLGKLHSERIIPVDAEAVKLVEEIRRLRGDPPPLAHPDTGKLTHFLLVRSNGKRPWYTGIQKTINRAAKRAQIKEHVWPHRLRHYLPFPTMSGDIGYGPAHIGRFGSQRGGGERIANIVFATLQALEEPKEFIAWVITGRSAIGRYGFRKRLLLHRQRRLQIDLRGLH